ncbi:DUF1327 domain-containing protein [Salmonella enterica]|nr:DUF1327 domain-containing protein [Salmonella enterica]EHZ8203752.1 DUF1327 domain-containing protein [Salmonella enterica]EIX8147099.1 DUF1327 domain-containing protein [Salmonella enterica]HBI5523949.1 DUF1327 domain-containing protein [Salmonella enterica subsp. enterica serovar Welikade]
MATVTLRAKGDAVIGGIFDLDINLARQKGASVEFYDAGAIKQAKALFLDVTV